MNTTAKSIKKIVAITGLFFGAFALSALATDWTPATQVAPGGNTAAPINVSSAKQSKAGPFAIGTLSDPEAGLDLQVIGVAKLGALFVNGDVTVPSGKTYTNKIQIGNTDAGSVNYVLTKTDAVGTAEWRAPAVQTLTVSEVKDFSVNIVRKLGIQSLTTPTPYLFCALSRIESEMGRVNAGSPSSGYCDVKRNADGKWTVSGNLADDPDYKCTMTCFK